MTVKAFGNYELDKGYDVSAPVSLYHFVKADGAGAVTPVTDTADVPLGVAQFHVTASEMARGKGASVRGTGISEVYVTGAVLLGQLAGLQNDGTVSVADSGDRVVGVFRSDGADGGRAAVEVSLPGYLLP